MKTLIIVSHPDIETSNSQQFLKEALAMRKDITYHHLETVYPDGYIDARREQELIRQHDRIIFQFPFYWYSSPPMLKQWQDTVLIEHFAYGDQGDALRDKSFGIVVVIGVAKHAYQMGGKEQFSIDQLLTPYQAMAHKTGMKLLKPFPIYQFAYMTDRAKQSLLIAYQQYMTLSDVDSLSQRTQWFIDRLSEESAVFELEEIQHMIEDLQLEIEELRLYLDQKG